MAIDGVDIKNNIMYSNAGYGLTSYDAHGGGVVVDQNLCFGNLLGPYNFTAGGSDYSYALGMTLTSDPLFVNGRSAGFDPHLTSNSPAANNAVNLYSIFTTDKNGAVRRATGTWDLGGYIYSNAPAAPVNSGTTLRLTLRNGNVELRWPLSSADYIVQSKPITNPGGAWQDVSVVPVLDQNENLVSLPISEPGRIFRLRNRSVSVVSAVALSMSVQNGNFQVRWPLDSGDYVLQSKSVTQPGSAWQDVSITPMQDQNQNMVSFTMADAGRIFRLRSGTVLFGL